MCESNALGDAYPLSMKLTRSADIADKRFKVRVLLLTPKEVEFYRHGGLLHYVLRQLAKAA